MVKQINSLKCLVRTARLTVLLCAFFLFLGGCRQDYSLSPPADSEKISVTVKLPEGLKNKTMWVMYRSATCKHIGTGASGQRTERDGYHSVYKELERQGQSDLYQVELPKDGGGACRWHLANVTFGVEYADLTRFGENVIWGGGGGVVVMFDRNNSPRGGADFNVDGDLTIRRDYYPWLSEAFIGGYRKHISLAGEGDIYLMYRALQARNVYFEPVFHSDFLVKSEGVKVKSDRNYITFTYPDGSVVSDRRSQPDFLKLQTLRTGRARECFSIIRYYKCPDRRPQLLPEWLPDPDNPGFGRYFIADEWGNELPRYHYRLLGKSGQSFQGRTDPSGRTQPLPDSAHPPLEVQFPERK